MKISDLKTLTNLPVATQLTGHGVGLGVGDWDLHSDFSEDHELQALQKIGVRTYIDTNKHRVFFHWKNFRDLALRLKISKLWSR